MMENLYCVSLAASVIALIFAWLQSKKVLAFSEGTPLMQKISRAIRTGASAFLKRQYRTVAVFLHACSSCSAAWRRPGLSPGSCPLPL